MQRQTLSGPVAAPFVKWAGGKSQILSTLDLHVPKFTRYFEPFLGGGALFFHLASTRPQFTAHLSDANSELIRAYNVLKNRCHALIMMLEKHQRNYGKAPVEYYYRLRAATSANNLEAAARFITLNKTCYNGLYRVNRRGTFNVPIGRYRNPKICDRDQLKSASAILNYCDAKIVAIDYKVALKRADNDDFVYLDPPFDPLSSTAHFVDYTRSGFSERDQIELAEIFRELDSRGCKVLLSNSDTKLTKDLYSRFRQQRVRVVRTINSNGLARTGHTELLISNYAD